MLTGNLQLLQSYTGEKTFYAIADFNRKALKGLYPKGEWIFIDNVAGIKALVLDRSNDSDALKEFHRLFIDIHIPLKGSDRFFLADEITEVVQSYQQEPDYSIVKADTSREILLAVGDFVLVEPGEVHCNILDQGSIKTVIKLPFPWPKL